MCIEVRFICVHAWLHLLVNECVIVLAGLGGEIKGRPCLSLQLAFISELTLNWKCNFFPVKLPLSSNICLQVMFLKYETYSMGGPRRTVYCKATACFVLLLILWQLKYVDRRAFELVASVSPKSGPNLSQIWNSKIPEDVQWSGCAKILLALPRPAICFLKFSHDKACKSEI